MKNPIWKWTLTRLFVAGLSLVISAHTVVAAQFSEPDVVIFGKVLNVGGGGAHQLYEGTLQFTLVSSGNATQLITRTTDLYPVGSGDEYSYRHSIKMFVQAENHETGTGISVTPVPVTYSIINATLDGFPVTPADPAQLRQLIISSASRGGEFQVDLLVSRPETDSDNDGMPDWWEDMHELGKFNPADASADPDGDGLTNLQEYSGGTDPNVANTSAQVMETVLQVPVGGTAGLMLNVVAQGVNPADLYLSFTNALGGIVWQRDGVTLPVGTEFSWEEMKEGRISAVVASSFSSGTVPLNLRNGSNIVSGVSLRLQGFSPELGMSAVPSLWLNQQSYTPGSDWQDLSGNARVAYQPTVSAQPSTNGSGGSVGFTSSRFMYVDDRQWSPDIFTALVAFHRDANGGTRQTLFNNSKVEISITGASNETRRMNVRQNRRAVESLNLHQTNGLITLYSAGSAAWLDVAHQARYFSISNSTAKASAYTTLGASRALTASAATNFFKGGLRELVFFDNLLSIKSQGQLQDYMLSRWEQVKVWNYRNAVLPIGITGAALERNSVAGGYGDDDLRGGNQADILRGGPGANNLTGGESGDRFVFEPNESEDTVHDYDLAEGDVLDLNAVFADVRGNPELYVQMRPVVVRDTNGYPQVDTIIDISYSGNVANAVDQSITLKNVSLDQTELLSYLAGGSIQLGGLSFSEPAVATLADRVMTVGQSTWLEVLPTGAQPSSYRWQFNGIDIPGGNTNMLFVAPTNRAGEGYYSVVISNQGGSVTSSPMFMQVIVPQSFAVPEMDPDGSIRFKFRDQDGFLASDLSRFDVQWTTNLTAGSTSWISTGAELSITNGYIMYTDPDAGTRPQRIYRVIERGSN